MTTVTGGAGCSAGGRAALARGAVFVLARRRNKKKTNKKQTKKHKKTNNRHAVGRCVNDDIIFEYKAGNSKQLSEKDQKNVKNDSQHKGIISTATNDGGPKTATKLEKPVKKWKRVSSHQLASSACLLPKRDTRPASTFCSEPLHYMLDLACKVVISNSFCS